MEKFRKLYKNHLWLKIVTVIVVIINQIENDPELLAYKILDELTKKSD